MDPKVVTFSGEVDFTARPALCTKLADLADADVAIVDLSAVTFLDSSALSEFVFLAKNRARATRPILRLVSSRSVLHVFTVTGCTSLVRMYSTLDAALQSP